MVKLTKELALERNRAQDLSSVQNLNLWGKDLDDVSLLKSFSNVEVLSLSVNRISTLEPFSHCRSLRELYLRKNSIADLREVEHLKGLPNLRILWLSENPCAERQDYREFVLQRLPNLTKLDNTDVTQEERAAGIAAAAAVVAAKAPEKETRPKQRRRSEPPRDIPEGKADRKEGDGQDDKAARPTSTQHNVMCAILALLEEMDTQHLKWIRTEVDRRIRGRP